MSKRVRPNGPSAVAALARATAGAPFTLMHKRSALGAAELLGVTAADVETLCRSGLLPATFAGMGFGESLWQVHDEDLHRFLRDHGQAWFEARRVRVIESLEQWGLK